MDKRKIYKKEDEDCKIDVNQQMLEEKVAFIRGQINPHFVFNALNTSIAISRFDEEEARELLVELSKYLRYSFDFAEDRDWETLHNELDFLKTYLKIEKARFEEKVDVTINFSSREDMFIPKMFLVPIVENALLHGTMKKRKGGKVFVDLVEDGEGVFIQVSDEGVGMTQAEIDEALNHFDYKGIGLGNINKKCIELTGKPLEIVSEVDIGTKVRWRLNKGE
jgi:LytS/YehU family sensor histidine kinase